MKIGVIMGGISSEREVSLNTGREIANNLDKNKYEVVPIIIDKKEDIIEKTRDIDFAFIALHGKFGEDGIVQAVLETLDIPYSGCSPLASGVCMDKSITKSILKTVGVSTADWFILNSADKLDLARVDAIGYPVVVKPNSGGSSVATAIANDEKDIEEAVAEALKFDSEVMIEKYIKGAEITCCMMDGILLPVIAIKPKSHFFDYSSKYLDGGADEVIIELESPIREKVEEAAGKCWKHLKCSVYARVDIIIGEDDIYVLEINTLPGLTKNSLFPKSAKAYGLDFLQFLDKIIQLSLKSRN
ncbi:D-alanine--D-alanine ligase [Lutispora sp.]|uniref:D-alanine--D-alanine ligase n=1 Tax=Lutispora sp. TaxID=2828727 RepID=UPI002B21A099|nr:D-alanine--D-alanine ligase [Lutispora sp.]MEA4960272.1 D-alanine--D-alanine ligase [Lutispora sp.]